MKPTTLTITEPAGVSRKDTGPDALGNFSGPPEVCDILRNKLQFDMKVRVGDLIDKHPVFAIKPTASLATCMQMFQEKKILAAPVFELDEYYVEDYDDEGYFTGWPEVATRAVALVNQLDLVHFINKLSYAKQAKLADMKLNEVMDMHDEHRDISIPHKASLFKVMWYMARGHPRVLLSDEGQGCGVCSLSDVNVFLNAHIFSEPDSIDLHTVARMTLREAGFGKDKFGKVSASATVSSAIDFMFKERIGVVAVVDDETGAILGQFSARDLRGIGPRNYYRFQGEMLTFMSTFSPENLNPRIITMDSCVAQASAMFAEERSHYLWTVDANGKPTTVITLTDIMRLSHRSSEYGGDKIMTPRSQWSTIKTPSPRNFDNHPGFDAEEGEDGIDVDAVVDASLGFEDPDSEDDAVNEAQLELLAVTEINDQTASVITPKEIQDCIWITTDQLGPLPQEVQNEEEFEIAVEAEYMFEEELAAARAQAESADYDAMEAAMEAAEYEEQYGPMDEEAEIEAQIDAELEAEARQEYETAMRSRQNSPRIMEEEQEYPIEQYPDDVEGGFEAQEDAYLQAQMENEVLAQEQAEYEEYLAQEEEELAQQEAEAYAQEQEYLAAQEEQAAYEEQAAQAELQAINEQAYEDEKQAEAEAEVQASQEIMQEEYEMLAGAGFPPTNGIELSNEEQADLAVTVFEATYTLLKAVAELNKAGHISLREKSFLKNLVVSQDPSILDISLQFLESGDAQWFGTALVYLARGY